MASTPISRIRAKIYSHKLKFTPREAAAIMLNIDAEKMVDNEDYKNIELLAEILKNLAFSGIFKEIEIGQDDYFNEAVEYIESIAAIELKQWALDNDYNWLEENNLLKEEIVLSVSEEIKTCENIIKSTATENEALKDEITRLKAEIAELKAHPPQAVVNDTVDYNNFTIYGHTSENLKMLFTVAKKIANKCDPDNPHSYPTKEQLTEYIKAYHSDNNKLCEAIYQIVIPEKVKTRGRPPEGVETFESFL